MNEREGEHHICMHFLGCYNCSLKHPKGSTAWESTCPLTTWIFGPHPEILEKNDGDLSTVANNCAVSKHRVASEQLRHAMPVTVLCHKDLIARVQPVAIRSLTRRTSERSLPKTPKLLNNSSTNVDHCPSTIQNHISPTWHSLLITTKPNEQRPAPGRFSELVTDGLICLMAKLQCIVIIPFWPGSRIHYRTGQRMPRELLLAAQTATLQNLGTIGAPLWRRNQETCWWGWKQTTLHWNSSVSASPFLERKCEKKHIKQLFAVLKGIMYEVSGKWLHQCGGMLWHVKYCCMWGHQACGHILLHEASLAVTRVAELSSGSSSRSHSHSSRSNSSSYLVTQQCAVSVQLLYSIVSASCWAC